MTTAQIRPPGPDGPATAIVESLEHQLAALDLTGLGDPEAAAVAVRALAESGVLHLPRPGGGATAERWQALCAIGRADVVLARLAEGHADADAILAELAGREPGPGELWGVWAADPPSARVQARRGATGWRLAGTKPWCSGAGACSHALVTAHADDGYRLFAVRMADGTQPMDGTWPAYGMAGSDSRSVRLDGVPAEPVGEPGIYLDRAGFWHGGIGVAAVWLGGATGVADALAVAQRRRPLDAHALAHAGAVDAALHAACATLSAAAAAVDSAPEDAPLAQLIARRARAVVERTVAEVLERVGRALGAVPLSLDARHSRRVADLTVFVRQSHAERDLEALGRLALDEPPR